MRRPLRAVAAVLTVLILSSCASGAGQGGPGDDAPGEESAPGEDAPGPTAEGTGGRDPALSGDLTVFAAASLHGVFEDLAAQFSTARPQVQVRFSFAGSSDLVAQLDAGAPADVLATADESTMADALDAGSVQDEPVVFATNALTLITPQGNPAGITGPADLAGADLVVCAPQVPCGAATARWAANLDLTLHPVSEEGSVTDVLGKVTSGQAEAGLVYTSDVRAAGSAVEVIGLPGADDVVNRYPIAVTARTEQADLARAWVDFVLGPQGRAALTEAGFGTP